MSLSTYTDLQAAIARLTHRTDLTAQIPTYIAMAEGRLNRDVRHPFGESYTTGTVASSVLLPADFLEVKSLTISAGGTAIAGIAKSVSYIRSVNATLSSSGLAQYYAVQGLNLLLAPSPATAGTYGLDYYAALPPLATAPGNTNWLMTAFPDIYVYASLLEAAIDTRDSTIGGIAGPEYETRISAINRLGDRAKHGAGKAMQADFTVP